MNDTQITLVRDSWAKVAPIAPAAATLFYDRLFATAPSVQPLFPDDITEQKDKLMEMLSTVVNGLSDLDRLVPELQALGRRHAGYGAVPEHYDVVGDCLLWTLEQGLTDDFTPEVREAWIAAYGLLARTMTAAANTERSSASASAAISGAPVAGSAPP